MRDWSIKQRVADHYRSLPALRHYTDFHDYWTRIISIAPRSRKRRFNQIWLLVTMHTTAQALLGFAAAYSVVLCASQFDERLVKKTKDGRPLRIFSWLLDTHHIEWHEAWLGRPQCLAERYPRQTWSSVLKVSYGKLGTAPPLQLARYLFAERWPNAL